jgi:hypothetical protein
VHGVTQNDKTRALFLLEMTLLGKIKVKNQRHNARLAEDLKENKTGEIVMTDDDVTIGFLF